MMALDLSDYLHGRPDGGAPADAASPGGDDPAGGHVPLSSTLRIEYRQIRSTMDIRGISDTLWKRVSHPLATIEYILIPLLMRCLKVTDELAPPALPGAGAGVQTARPAPHPLLLAGEPGVPAGHPFPGGAAGPGPDPNRGNHLVEGVT